MNRLYSTVNSGGMSAWIVAEDEDDARVVAKSIGHVRKPENLVINGDVTDANLESEGPEGLLPILESGFRGQLAINIQAHRMTDLLARIKHNVVIQEAKPVPATWVKSREAKD